VKKRKQEKKTGKPKGTKMRRKKGKKAKSRKIPSGITFPVKQNF